MEWKIDNNIGPKFCRVLTHYINQWLKLNPDLQ